MIFYYMHLSTADLNRLNQIMYDNYVYKNGQFLYPFCSGTANYYDADTILQLVTPLLESAANDANLTQSDRDFINLMLAGKQTLAYWESNGTVTPVPPSPAPV